MWIVILLKIFKYLFVYLLIYQLAYLHYSHVGDNDDLSWFIIIVMVIVIVISF